MASPRKLTKRFVDEAAIPAAGRALYWDANLRGFGLRVSAHGSRVYVVKYRAAGRQRWFTIGHHGSPWTPEEARRRAADILRCAANGSDPQQEKLERRGDLTVGELIDAYLADGPATKPDKRASTWAADRSNLNRHVRVLIGGLVARNVVQADIARMVTAISNGASSADIKTGPRGRAIVKGGSGTAERTLSTTAAMFAWAEQQGYVDLIPTKGIRLPRRRAKERFLSPEELSRLSATFDVLQKEQRLNATHADVLRLLTLTGARKSEILGLKWEEVDLRSRRLVLPPERSKSGGRSGERRIALSESAVILLRERPRLSNYVFASSRDPAKATVGLQRSWSRVRKAAGLEDVRIHDLRHTFASLALANGASLPLIGKALGHSSSRVTERYAHLADDPLDQLARAVDGMLSRGEATQRCAAR